MESPLSIKELNPCYPLVKSSNTLLPDHGAQTMAWPCCLLIKKAPHSLSLLPHYVWLDTVWNLANMSVFVLMRLNWMFTSMNIIGKWMNKGLRNMSIGVLVVKELSWKHGDVMKCFLHNWTRVWGIHQSSVVSLHKEPEKDTLMSPLLVA